MVKEAGEVRDIAPRIISTIANKRIAFRIYPPVSFIVPPAAVVLIRLRDRFVWLNTRVLRPVRCISNVLRPEFRLGGGGYSSSTPLPCMVKVRRRFRDGFECTAAITVNAYFQRHAFEYNRTVELYPFVRPFRRCVFSRSPNIVDSPTHTNYRNKRNASLRRRRVK